MDSTSQVLFEKNIPIKQTSSTTSNASQNGGGPSTSAGALEKSQNIGSSIYLEGIQVQIKMVTSNVDKHKSGSRRLEINLTDESDPYFLYSLSVSEEDFHLLKKEQNLLVDFTQFPVKLIELLENCLSCKYENNPRFIAVLDSPSSSSFISPGMINLQSSSGGASSPNAALSIFNIIETNSFRNITHLSLQMIPGNDAAIKKYLAALVKSFKDENKNLKRNLEETTNSLSDQLSLALNSKDQLRKELEEIKAHDMNLIQSLKLSNAEEMSMEKEKALSSLREMQNRFDTEKREQCAKFESQIATLTGKLTLLETTNNSLQASKVALESSEKDLSLKLSASRDQIDSFRREVLELRQSNKELDTIKFEQEKLNNQQRMEITALHQQLIDREEVQKRTNELLTSATEQKEKLSEQVESLKSLNSKLEETIRKASSEINKANEIIVKLQNEVKGGKAKLRSKTQSLLQQEKLLEERNKLIEQLERKEGDLKASLDKKEEDVKQLKQKISDLESIIAENKNALETNEHVIEWLHKQLNTGGSAGGNNGEDSPFAKLTTSSIRSKSVMGLTNTTTSGIPFEKFASNSKSHTSPVTSPLSATTTKNMLNGVSSSNNNPVDAIKQRIQQLKESSFRAPLKPISANNVLNSSSSSGPPSGMKTNAQSVNPAPVRSSYFG